MKYTYAYKSSDGSRHEASMNAESREAVFAALRKQGIKAIKVVAADGSKANGEVQGVRKRVVVLFVVIAAVLAGVLTYLRTSGEDPVSEPKGTPRHQIYGDPAVMEGFERGEFATVLPREGDRLLAWFAVPGRLMCPKDINVMRLSPRIMQEFVDYAKTDLKSEFDIEILDADVREVRELKQIVNDMRQEMRDYLANGNGTPRSFWRRLCQRSMQEIQIFERTRRELENEKNDSVWRAKNDALRLLGLRTITRKADQAADR